MSKIFYHADDFGVTYEQSKSILDCHINGCLNSVSIIPNSSEAAASYELIRQYVDSGEIRLVIHLNFVEGHCMADPASVPTLVNENGYFKCTYGSMLKYNFSSSRASVKKEFKEEIKAQICAIISLAGTKTINVDSHQHYLQIPMIFDALCEVVKEEGYTLHYLRIPVDPVSPIISAPSLFFKVPVINHVKWTLLRALKPSKAKLSSLKCTIPLFFGMPFTCQMTYDKVSKLLPKYKKLAEKNKQDLELMFHPGAVLEPSKLLDSSQEDLVNFYSSDFRGKEAKALLSL